MGEFNIIRILNGEVILSKESFERFVKEMKLPIFKDEFKISKYNYKMFFTVFNKVIIRRLVEVSKLSTAEIQK